MTNGFIFLPFLYASSYYVIIFDHANRYYYIPQFVQKMSSTINTGAGGDSKMICDSKYS